MEHGQHIVAVAAVIFRGETLLAMRRSAAQAAGPGLWETLSGRVEHGEHPLVAVHREISEECGLAVEVDPRPADAYAATRAGQPMIVLLYRARYLAGAVQLSAEHDAFGWLSDEEFARRSTLPALVAAVRTARRLAL